jgi:hypothetical protein
MTILTQRFCLAWILIVFSIVKLSSADRALYRNQSINELTKPSKSGLSLHALKRGGRPAGALPRRKQDSQLFTSRSPSKASSPNFMVFLSACSVPFQRAHVRLFPQSTIPSDLLHHAILAMTTLRAIA